MIQKDFFMGVIVTMLVGAIVAIVLLVKENLRLKSAKTATPTASISSNGGAKEGVSNTSVSGTNNTKNKTSSQDCSNKKNVYPDATGIPIDWYGSVYTLKNSWVNELATANLLQIKTYGNLGEVVVIANCKLVEPRQDGYRLILEDPYDTIRTELIPTARVTARDGKFDHDTVNGFIGNILIIRGISKEGKFTVKEIKKSCYTKKII